MHCPMCYGKNKKVELFKANNAFISVGELSKIAYNINDKFTGGGIVKEIWI